MPTPTPESVHAYLKSIGIDVLLKDVRDAFNWEGETVPNIATAVFYANIEWLKHTGEHDRKPGSGIVNIFRDAAGTDFGLPPLYGVPVQGNPPEWCGFTVGACYARAGMAEQLRNAFYHTKNVETHYTYAEKMLANPKRFKAEIKDPITGQWVSTRAYHAAKNSLRQWFDWKFLQLSDIDDLPFVPGATVLYDWQRNGRDAEHIGLVRAWDGERYLDTFEGNRHGKGPNNEDWRESVVTVRYDLHDSKVRAQLYGVGIPSPLDFMKAEYR